jgi:phosphoglycerate kinase
MTVKSIDEIPRTELSGQRVMVRMEPDDDMTLQNSLRTLAFLSQAGARVVIAAGKHLDDKRSRLTHLFGRQVRKLHEWKGETGLRTVAHLPEGEIMFIENLALEPGEKMADDRFGKELAHLCDIYDGLLKTPPRVHEYPAGTWGPAEFDRLLEKSGHHWFHL